MRVTRKDFYFYFFKFDRHIPIAVFKEPYSGVLNGTRVPCNFFIFYFFLKFDRPILIAAFKESYSGVLNGTRAPWTWVPWNFFFFFKFDRAKPIATFWLSYNGVLYGTQAPWTRVPCNILFIYFFFQVWSGITWFSTNRFFHWNSILRKSSFKTGAQT